MNLIVAIGLAIALEGAAYALFPDAMRRAAMKLFELGQNELRYAGLAAFLFGSAIVLAAMWKA